MWASLIEKNTCNFTRTSYATNMSPFTRKYSLLWKDCCLHQIRKTIEKKGHYSKTASFHFFMKERHISKGYFTIKSSITVLKEGGEWRKATRSCKTKKLREISKNQKNLEQTIKTIEPKRTKKNKENINSRLFRKLGCFTKPPWELFLGFYCSFWSYYYYWSFSFSRGFFGFLKFLKFFCCF